jgi:hypothetical protein
MRAADDELTTQPRCRDPARPPAWPGPGGASTSGVATGAPGPRDPRALEQPAHLLACASGRTAGIRGGEASPGTRRGLGAPCAQDAAPAAPPELPAVTSGVLLMQPSLTARAGRRLACGVALASSAILLPAGALAGSPAPGRPLIPPRPRWAAPTAVLPPVPSGASSP